MILLGINTSGLIHFGNYITLIKPVLKIKKKNIFLADLHCLSKNKHYKNVNLNKLTSSLIFKSFFKKKIFLHQSNHKNILFLFWVISCFYNINKTKNFLIVKDKINLSIAKVCYPILMCSDIITINNFFTFIGIDQIQHIELYNKIVNKISKYINVFFLKKNKFIINNKVLYSYNKKKMSKSNKNDLFLFSNYKNLLLFFNNFFITLKRKKSIFNFFELVTDTKISFKNSFNKNKIYIVENIYFKFLKKKLVFINLLKNLNFYLKKKKKNNSFFNNIILNNIIKIKQLFNI
ncbi:tryptophanyl-tRNA synthetase [Candidatus Carsonella ruddii PV]|uniref:tryptophan--tRNA ligase n=1 Tax=Carsonella ruddii (strain PV) TaxID=387662 RepID=Q05FM6_CARRP|nr:hypothetical protein [Candidatus Carsonella ruddii]BAF35145.1 tryptophanyl-tRNA synthetase [Candidatus Carsonella ruddii PV]